MVNMQTIEDYARKSGVSLQKEGSCQFCGSRVTGGVYQCFEIFHRIAGEASNPNDIKASVQLIIVDAHALQHSEVHGVRNNNYHLLRLLGIYRHETSSRIRANYSFLSPILDLNNSIPYLESPIAGDRGTLTVTDVVDSKGNSQLIETINNWGRDVFKAWGVYKEWAEEEWSRLQV